MPMETTSEVLDRIFEKYYPDGLLWEVRDMRLYVYWGQTRFIGMVHEVVALPEEKIALLLNAWFEQEDK